VWLKKWLTKNVKDDVQDQCVFMDQGGELYKSKAIRDLFEKEFGYEIQGTGTGGIIRMGSLNVLTKQWTRQSGQC